MFGCGRTGLNMHFGGLNYQKNKPHRKIMRKVHDKIVFSFLPRSSFWSRNLALPFEHIGSAIIFIFNGFGDKAKRVVTPPVFSLLFEATDDQLIHLSFFHRALEYKYDCNIRDASRIYFKQIRSKNKTAFYLLLIVKIWDGKMIINWRIRSLLGLKLKLKDFKIKTILFRKWCWLVQAQGYWVQTQQISDIYVFLPTFSLCAHLIFVFEFVSWDFAQERVLISCFYEGFAMIHNHFIISKN